MEKAENCLVPIDYMMVQDQTNSGEALIFNSNLQKKSIEKVYTVTTNKVPSGVIGSFDVSEAQNGSIMAWYKDEDINGLYELYIGQDGGVKANPNSTKLFNYFINVVEIDLSNLDTSNVTTMRTMFQRCTNLMKLNISNFNTEQVEDMRNMFNKCINLSDLNISNFNTKNVTIMSAMFGDMSNLKTLDLSNFNTSKVTDMSNMFSGCTSIEKLFLNNFDTSNVTTMKGMFVGMSNLKTLDVSSFNTSKVNDMTYMFGTVQYSDGTQASCASIENLDLSSFDTSNVTTMGGIFYGTTALKNLKLNKASFNKLTEYSVMFSNSGISNITVKDSSSKMFIEERLAEVGKTATVTIG